MKVNCPFKIYKDLFGKKNEGIHKFKFTEGTSIIDYLITILFCCLISHLTKIPLVLVTIIILLLGIFIHLLFGLETNSLKYLGIKCYWPVLPKPPDPLVVSESSSDNWNEIGDKIGEQIWNILEPFLIVKSLLLILSTKAIKFPL